MQSFMPCLCACLAGVLCQAALPDLGPGHTFKPRMVWTDGLGRTHTRYVHYYKGLPVWGDELVDHTGPGGKPAPKAFNRKFDPGRRVWFPVQVDFPIQGGTNAELMEHHLVEYRLAVRTLVRPVKGVPDRQEVLRDAATGEELVRMPLESYESAVSGTGRSLYSGTVALNTTALPAGGGFLLKDLTRGRHGRPGGNRVEDERYGAGPPTPLHSATNIWGDGVPAAGAMPSSSTMAVDLAVNLQDAWDYFARFHGRLGVDGLGSPVRGLLHPPRTADQAFWDPIDGAIHVAAPRRLWPMNTLPVVAHEFTYGVTQFSANLLRVGEPGAVNEATSDFFGLMVAAWVRNGRGATIGDSAAPWAMVHYELDDDGHAAPVVVRNFINPEKGEVKGEAAWSSRLAREEIHEASLPLSHCFYLICTGGSAEPGPPASSSSSSSSSPPRPVKGIGNDRAAKIWYRALTTYPIELGFRTTMPDESDTAFNLDDVTLLCTRRATPAP